MADRDETAVYCHACGTPFTGGENYCAACGAPRGRAAPAESDPTLDAGAWLFVGVLAAVIGLFAFAVVCGAVAAFAGYRARVQSGSSVALVVGAIGVAEILIWGAFVVSLFA